MQTATARAPKVSLPGADAPLTLLEPPLRQLGLLDQAVLWGNLGITLTIPVAAAFVLQPLPDLPPLSLAAAIAAVLVGTLLGSLVLAPLGGPGHAAGGPEAA